MYESYYKTLNVKYNASLKEIKKSYKRLALKYHPDRVPIHKRQEAQTKFQEISLAYSTLCDNYTRTSLDDLNDDENEVNNETEHEDDSSYQNYLTNTIFYATMNFSYFFDKGVSIMSKVLDIYIYEPIYETCRDNLDISLENELGSSFYKNNSNNNLLRYLKTACFITGLYYSYRLTRCFHPLTIDSSIYIYSVLTLDCFLTSFNCHIKRFVSLAYRKFGDRWNETTLTDKFDLFFKNSMVYKLNQMYLSSKLYYINYLSSRLGKFNL